MTSTSLTTLVVGSRKGLADAALANVSAIGEATYLHEGGVGQVDEVSPQLLKAADAWMTDASTGAIVSTSESTMLVASFLRERYGLPGPSFESTVVGVNKLRMRQATSAVVKSARYWTPAQFLAQESIDIDDVVLKPLAASSARGVRLLSRSVAADALRSSKKFMLVEEALAVDREFHVDGVVSNGAVEWVECSAYDRPVLRAREGTRWSTVLAHEDPLRPVLEDLAARVLAALGTTNSVFHMEFLQCGDDVYFGEVGLRPAGTGIAQRLVLTTGADVWQAHVRAQCGLPTNGFGPRRQGAATTGLIMARADRSGVAPPPAECIKDLPGVVDTVEGRLAAGEKPGDACAFEYIAFFEGVTEPQLGVLVDLMSGGAP